MGKIPRAAIYQLLAQLDGAVGLYIHDLDSGEVFQIDSDRVFPSASVIKIPILALLLRDVQEGRADWNARRPIASCNRVGGTGILCELEPDYAPTVETLAKLMIVLSDNIATNELIDLLGMERVNAFCREMGYHNTVLMRKMLDFEAIRQGKNNYMSAGEAGRLLTQAAKGELVNPQVSQTMISIMERQQCRGKLPALIPAVPSYVPEEDKRKLKPDTVLVANKTGELVGIQHDVGIFTLPDGRRYVIAAFTGELADDAQGVMTIQKLSRAVYDALA